MLRIIEKSTQRHKALAHSNTAECGLIWTAKDEDDFFLKIDTIISAIPSHEIWDSHTPEEIIQKELDMSLRDFQLERQHQGGSYLNLDEVDVKNAIAYGDAIGWFVPLYRADFDENRDEGMYDPTPITKFQAYKLFLEYVSPGAIIVNCQEPVINDHESEFMDALKEAIFRGKKGLANIDEGYLHRWMLEEKVKMLEKILFEVDNEDHFGNYGESRHD